MRNKKKVTITDVAKHAGVSITTVSHVINSTASISKEVKQQVYDSINRLGYEPLKASNFRQGQRMIACFIPDLRNEFYAQSVQSIFDTAWKYNYGVTVCDIKHLYSAKSQYLQNFIHNGISGIIFFGGTMDVELQIKSISNKVPVVLGDMHIPSTLTSHIDAVCTDNVSIMISTVKRLAKAGYRKIGYVSEDFLLANTIDRYEGFKLGLNSVGIPLDSKHVYISEKLRLNKVISGHDFMKEVLSKHDELPEVFMCTSDLIAIGIISALRENSYKVPSDIGIIGFDDISIASYSNPPLTTIAQDMAQIGRSCFMTLLERIENPSLSSREVMISAKFISRESLRL